MARLHVWLTMFCCAMMLMGRVALADPVADDVADYLNRFWAQPNPTAEQDLTLHSLAKKYGRDERLLSAELLLHLQQRRFVEADRVAGELLTLDPGHRLALQAKVWLAMLHKEFALALAYCESWARNMPTGADDKSRDTLAEARFIGSVLGFSNGPAREEAAAMADVAERKILASLTAEQRLAAREARQAVLEKFTELEVAQAAAKEDKVATKEAEKERTLATLEKRRGEVEGDAAALQKERAELADKLRQELSELQKADAPLASQLSSLQVQSVWLNYQPGYVVPLSPYGLPYNGYYAGGYSSGLGVGVYPYGNYYYPQGYIAFYDPRYNELQSAASRIMSQRYQLQQQGWFARQQIGGQIDGIDSQLQQLSSENRRLAGASRNANRPIWGSQGKSHALALTATAFTTYEPFPLDVEKTQLLKRLGKR